MQLREFYDYKNQLMSDLLTNPEIVELLDTEAVIKDSSQLAYKQVFPLEYIPDTVEHGKTFICFDVDVQEAGKTFLSPTLYIWVFSHKSKLRLPQGGVRVDEICIKICEEINGSFNYGLGQLDLYSVKRFAPMTDFQGKVMTFKAQDFSKQFNPRKSIPSNRKTG